MAPSGGDGRGIGPGAIAAGVVGLHRIVVSHVRLGDLVGLGDRVCCHVTGQDRPLAVIDAVPDSVAVGRLTVGAVKASTLLPLAVAVRPAGFPGAVTSFTDFDSVQVEPRHRHVVLFCAVVSERVVRLRVRYFWVSVPTPSVAHALDGTPQMWRKLWRGLMASGPHVRGVCRTRGLKESSVGAFALGLAVPFLVGFSSTNPEDFRGWA